ncbi:MAG: hypothetical protein KTR31_42030 [Myxococcales bacterium]|nr:hypothetical protein [Myxococcales bacterium]
MGLLVASLLVLCASVPLFVYTTSLAVFGLAHVAVELRYVEGRFGLRLSRRLLVAVGVLLAGVVGLRLLGLAGIGNPMGRIQAELVLVALITGTVAWDISLRMGLARLTSAVAAAVIAAGAALAPIPTMLALGVLHNWTPVGFLAEATHGRDRRRWMTWSAVVFVAAPLLLALGPVHALVVSWGLPDGTPFAAGGLSQQLGAYLPRSWHAQPWAAQLFSAIVFAQCMHYVAVIGVLPGLPTERSGPLTSLSWPVYLGLVAAATAMLLVGYLSDFAGTRVVYGVFAAVHAWVELPVLIAALSARPVPA